VSQLFLEFLLFRLFKKKSIVVCFNIYMYYSNLCVFLFDYIDCICLSVDVYLKIVGIYSLRSIFIGQFSKINSLRTVLF